VLVLDFIVRQDGLIFCKTRWAMKEKTFGGRGLNKISKLASAARIERIEVCALPGHRNETWGTHFGGKPRSASPVRRSFVDFNDQLERGMGKGGCEGSSWGISNR